MGFMLAKIQAKYGQVDGVAEVMRHLTPALEEQGWRLVGAFETAVGPFYEVWDLWDVGGDASAIATGLSEARKDPDFAAWAVRLPEFIEHEEIRYLEKLDYGTGR